MFRPRPAADQLLGRCKSLAERATRFVIIREVASKNAGPNEVNSVQMVARFLSESSIGLGMSYGEDVRSTKRNPSGSHGARAN